MINDLVKNLKNSVSNLTIPTYSGPNDIQRILSSAGGLDLVNIIINAVNNGTTDLSSVKIPVTDSIYLAVNSILPIIKSTTGVLNNTISALQSVVPQLGTVTSAFENIVNLFSGISSTCASKVANLTKDLIANATTNAASCVTNEVAVFQNYVIQYKALYNKIQDEVSSNSTIAGSTIEQTVSLISSAALELQLVKAKILICEGAQAVMSANNIPTVLKSAIACIG